MATGTPLAAGERPRLVSEGPHQTSVQGRVKKELATRDRGALLVEVEPVLRVAAAVAGIALAGYAAVAVVVLLLVGAE